MVEGWHMHGELERGYAGQVGGGFSSSINYNKIKFGSGGNFTNGEAEKQKALM
jgi:hypothetical protein